ncbi:hypothetical protein CANARDRAFT_28368 [[Candida] arabinofermentans NRRL YB-2248]|uniref:Zn(2)-C6 fungal-type domain-containing protein n=1 Tax=[Candida] arabinofermentans NRRL YB-2248 TaxID=983967 RepID=A0A1E4T1H9_9ASCO|nr:hypothetical protein CANARDRAFT_28368 [[Candida] arabinofermentans NRRL YB-2248]
MTSSLARPAPQSAVAFPTTQQALKKKRCAECKRRKKRCDGDGSRCNYCEKRGIECIIESVHIVQYTGQQRRKTRIEKIEKSSSQRSFPPLIDFVSTSPKSLNKMSDTTTPPSVVARDTKSMITPNSPPKSVQDAFNELSGTGIPVVYLPTRKIIQTSNSTPTVHDDTEQITVYNDEAILDSNFSLYDFILSATRVQLVDSYPCDVDKDRVRLAKDSELFKQEQNVSRSNISPWISTPMSSTASIVSPSNSVDLNRDLEATDLSIDIAKLKNVVFIQEAAVTNDDKAESFVNLPDTITREFADDLFKHFCNVCQERDPTKPSSINVLKVCLPLILGNITVLKSVLLVAYYDRMSDEANHTEFLISMKGPMKDIHLGVLAELQQRLIYLTSVCCDHTIYLVLLLLTIEVINGANGSLYGKLITLGQNLVSLRGGVTKLASNVTGVCLLKLLLTHFSVGRSFLMNELECGDPLSLKDFFYILDYSDQMEFFDNFNCSSRLSLSDMKQVVGIYGHITLLQNLAAISYDANHKGSDTSLKIYGNYESVSSANLEMVLQESDSLEREIDLALNGDFPPNISMLHQLQLRFALHASSLYLYQSIYRQISLSPKTVFTVKLLLAEAVNLFEYYKTSSQEEAKNSTVFHLALFLLGVDLVSRGKREWYKTELLSLYNLTKKSMIKTCVSLLEQVWKLNPEGSTFVDWKHLSKKHLIVICLCS